MPRIYTEEQKQALRERLAQGREQRKRNLEMAREAATMPLTERPEFRAAVAAAVAQQTAAMMNSLAERRENVAVDGEAGWAEKLAMAIAQLTDQDSGVGMKRLPPEIVKARALAADRMHAAIREALANDTVPIYSLQSKVILPLETGESLIEPIYRGQDNKVWPTHIRWWSAPNLAMVPENEPAKKIYAAWRASNGNGEPDDGKLDNGKPCPPSGGHVETVFALTDQGHAVTGGGIQARKDRSPSGPRSAIIVDQANSPVAQDTGGGPPYVDVRILGSIQPPARQNG